MPSIDNIIYYMISCNTEDMIELRDVEGILLPDYALQADVWSFSESRFLRFLRGRVLVNALGCERLGRALTRSVLRGAGAGGRRVGDHANGLQTGTGGAKKDMKEHRRATKSNEDNEGIAIDVLRT